MQSPYTPDTNSQCKPALDLGAVRREKLERLDFVGVLVVATQDALLVDLAGVHHRVLRVAIRPHKHAEGPHAGDGAPAVL